MSHFTLRCTECRISHAADMASLQCIACGAPLEVEYDGTASPTPQPARWTGAAIPLPLHDAGALLNLGEGGTPCVELPGIGRMLGLQRLIAKLESLNPTGSFKDRGSAVMVSVAKERGVTEMVEDSSGNAGASVAAYAAKAGIRAHIFAPAGSPAPKIGQISVFGAQVHSINDTRDATAAAAVAFYETQGLVYASHNLSPYFVEGTKTFAYEVAQQLSGEAPEHVVIPVGNGSLFLGAWKGFRELMEGNHIGRIPRLHCIQATAFMPIAAAYRGVDWTARTGARTVAGGISSTDPPRKREVLRALRATNGVATAVADEEILRWQRLLAAEEGIYAEPTSAAALAGLEALVQDGHVRSDESVVVPITGSGLKDVPPP